MKSISGKEILDKLRKACVYAAKPVWDNLTFFITFTILLSFTYWANVLSDMFELNRLILCRTINYGEVNRTVVYLSIFYAYLLCCLFQLLHNHPKVKAWIKAIINILLMALVATELFLAYHFKFGIAPLSMLLLFQSDPSESAEFAQTYILNKGSIVILLSVALAVILPVFGSKILRGKVRPYINRLAANWIASLIVLFIVGTAIYGQREYIYAHADIVMADSGYEMNKLVATASPDLITKSIFSYKSLTISSKDVEYIADNIDKIKVDSCSFTSPKIVFILGESYSKHHSGVYGYYLPTTPLLQKRKDDGELFIFTDVITPYNSTIPATQHMYSTASAEPGSDWSRRPLFQCVFRKAGYKVFWFDNQIVNTKSDVDSYNFLAYNYLNNPRIEAAAFDVRNTKRYSHDLDLLVEIDKYKAQASGKDLVVFHLMGQHIDPIARFPKTPEHIFFKPEDINRPDLDERLRKQIANYDNATRYNDKVVDAIISNFEDDDAIVVYVSDHGEEVNDYRHRIGRTYEYPCNKNQVKYQFEVPMMVWCSEKYRENHPEIVEQIKVAVDRPFINSDMCHLLFDLAGIQTDSYDPTRSPINSQFTPRKRYIANGEIYEEVMGR